VTLKYSAPAQFWCHANFYISGENHRHWLEDFFSNNLIIRSIYK